MFRLRVRALPFLAASFAIGYTGSSGLPPVEPTVARYAAALEKGDAAAVHAMLDAESRRHLSLDELRRILGEQRAELVEHARAVTAPSRSVAAEARLRYQDGEVVVLELRNGEFRVAAAAALPGNARTPAQALGQLRAVLARRSYAGLMRVLSSRTRASLEGEWRSLVEGLVEPDSLDIQVNGDAATVEVPGGHRVKLRREDGAWYVDDLN